MKMKRKNLMQVIFFSGLILPVLILGAENRDTWQQPDKVLEVIGVKPGMVIGEPGAGRGYFTFKLARKVGPRGKIYANDIVEKDLNTIKKRAKREGFTNIVTIKGEIEDPLFPVDELDMVFMSYVLHDMSRPKAFLINLKPYLKPEAPLVVLEQAPEKTGKTGHFWKKEKILKTVRAAGYRLERIETFLPKDNIYIFYLEQ
ncbi:MAG: class I SAM-dependent methyltransferase [Candidatus Aminicenantes bacterium]|nr:MAG: class I SAM-dependent methyltransferase [Candidatus Aminicenantes bacterium]